MLKVNAFYKKKICVVISFLTLLSLCSCEKSDGSQALSVTSSQNEFTESEEISSDITSGLINPSQNISSKPSDESSKTSSVTSSDKEETNSLSDFDITPFIGTEPYDNTAFENSAFIGNSVMKSLNVFNDVGEITYYTKSGLTVRTALTDAADDCNKTIVACLGENKYKKVVLMFGVNELGWAHKDAFKTDYTKLVKEVKSLQPEAEVCVMLLFPTTSEQSAKNNNGITNTRIKEYNKLITEMCDEEGLKTVAPPEFIFEKDGTMRPQATTDGVHLKGKYSRAWMNDLRQHLK